VEYRVLGALSPKSDGLASLRPSRSRAT